MKTKATFFGDVRYKIEDGGQAKIAYIEEDEKGEVPEEGMFVRLHSWSERRVHELANQFEGKRVKVTIEVIEESKN